MDEKLKSTIERIVLLSKQNQEFATELRRRLGISSPIVAISHDNQRIEHIEKYLGLDFYMDTRNSNVDYSFVHIPDVKAMLISDNREMMRFRCGTRYHKTDFREFCRYAHFQIEMLLNYYYDVINKSDLDDIKAHIKRCNPNGKGLDKAKSLEEIPYSVKLWAFHDEHKKEHKINWTLWNNIRKVRNELSHRSVTDDKLSIAKYQEQLKEQEMALTQKGYILFDQGNEEQIKEAKKIRGSEKYKKYEYLLWYHEMPFDTIVMELKKISVIICNAISNSNR